MEGTFSSQICRQINVLNFRPVCPPAYWTSSRCSRTILDSTGPELNSLSSLPPQLLGLLCPHFSQWQNYLSIYSSQKPRSYPGLPLFSQLPYPTSMLPYPAAISVLSSLLTLQLSSTQIRRPLILEHFPLLASITPHSRFSCYLPCLFSSAHLLNIGVPQILVLSI